MNDELGRDTNGHTGPGFWTRAAAVVVAAILANVAVWWIGATALDVPSEFPPLAGPGPAIFFTTVGGAGAVAVYKLIDAISGSPRSVFRAVALVVLLLTFLPDLWLLSSAGREAVPGATVPAVAVLMVMHVVAATILVVGLTGQSREDTASH